MLTKDDYFLPDMIATPEVLDQRYELFRQVLQGAQRMVVPSEFVKQMFVNNGYRGENIEVLPLGMAETTEHARTAVRTGKPLRFGFVGAVLPLKGAEVLARAFMATSRSDIRLTYHGREDILPTFSRSLRQLAAPDRRISFAGPFQPGAKDKVYEEIDVLVIPSTAHESFSLVAREALLRGIPVVASSAGALPEVIYDGVNGFLVAPGDVDGLSATINRLADRPELLSELQLPGPAPILSVDQHVERLLAIYDECRALPS
jgi:glycosyltransferase involved in cell wall biosynthesis